MRRRGAWLVIAGMLVLGACTAAPEGERPDEQATAAATAPASGSGFAAAFQQVSARYSELAERIQQELQQISADDETRLVAVVDELRTAAETARSELAALTIPREVASEMTGVLQLLDEQAAELQRLADAVGGRDTDAFRSATDALIDVAQRSAEARRRLETAIAACGAPCA